MRQNIFEGFISENTPESYIKEKYSLYSCHLCVNSFLCLQNLKEHQKIHTAVRECMCFECGRTFTSAECLKRHEMIHTGEKPYECHTLTRDLFSQET